MIKMNLPFRTFLFAAIMIPFVLNAQVSSEDSQYEISPNAASSAFEQALLTSPSNELLLSGYYFARLREAQNGPTKELNATEVTELKGIAQRIHESIPGSFTDQLIQYIQSEHTDEDFLFLKNASSMNPLDIRVQQLMVDHFMINQDPRELKLRIGILHQSGYFDRTLITYAEDLLELLPPNAVIITNGADDTYPLLVCRELFGTRRDITIVPLDLLDYSGFRDQVNNATKLTLHGGISREDQVVQLKKSRESTVFFALTLPQTWLMNMKGLEFHGLAIGQYAPQPAKLVDRFEQFVELTTIQPESAIAANYLPLLFTMIEYYQSVGKQAQANAIAEKIALIASHTDKPEVILDRLR